MKLTRFALILTLACAHWTGAAAQNDLKNPTPDGCPSDAQALPLVALFGRWQARIDGQTGVATVQLARHPDYAGVRGSISREGGRRAELAGDVDDEGLLTIDESEDGRAISATWSGAVQAGSCGKVLEGSWRRAGEEQSARFELRKLAPGIHDENKASKLKKP